MSIGKIIHQEAPKPSNPRNSEGAFLTLKDGRILFVFSRYCGDSFADHASADLAAIVSADGGRTWTEPRILYTCADLRAANLMSVSLLRMADGAVGLFYLFRKGWDDLRLHLRRSYDEGETFSEPVICMDSPLYYVVNNDRVVRTRSGRILIPAAKHDSVWTRDAEGNLKPFFDGRATACFFASDDDGKTFRPMPDKVVLPSLAHSETGMQEPGLIQLENGVLWGWARTDLGRQYEMFSMDDGAHWTAAQPSRFTGPYSPLSMKRLPDGRLLAVWNPVPLSNISVENFGPAWNGGRTPLVLAVSADEGQTWCRPVIIEDDPTAGYCYVAIHPMEDAVLLAYCGGLPEDGSCLNRLVMRRIEYDELRDL